MPSLSAMTWFSMTLRVEMARPRSWPTKRSNSLRGKVDFLRNFDLLRP
jgi:hypothetical protein